MALFDIWWLVIILLFGIVGFKRGLTRELVSFLGIFIVLILAFILKNPVSAFFYEKLPFIPFGGFFKGLTTLNILVYEILAFFLVASLLMIGLKVLLLGTKIFEKILTMTIILGIPSKLLGMVVGFLEGLVWVFVAIYILSLPIFKQNVLKESKWQVNITNNIPILSKQINNFQKVSQEIGNLKDKYQDKEITVDEFNYQSLELMLKYDVIKVNSVQILKEKGKLKFKGLDTLITTYGE